MVWMLALRAAACAGAGGGGVAMLEAEVAEVFVTQHFSPSIWCCFPEGWAADDLMLLAIEWASCCGSPVVRLV